MFDDILGKWETICELFDQVKYLALKRAEVRRRWYFNSKMNGSLPCYIISIEKCIDAQSRSLKELSKSENDVQFLCDRSRVWASELFWKLLGVFRNLGKFSGNFPKFHEITNVFWRKIFIWSKTLGSQSSRILPKLKRADRVQKWCPRLKVKWLQKLPGLSTTWLWGSKAAFKLKTCFFDSMNVHCLFFEFPHIRILSLYCAAASFIPTNPA